MQILSTRVLLSAAAIGVVSGLLFMLTGALHGLIVGAAPFLYGALISLYIIPGALAQLLLKLPGVALIAAVIAGLMATISPIQAGGGRALAYIAGVGLLQELGYAVLRYRRWPIWPALIVAAVLGIGLAVVFHIVLNIGSFTPVLQLLQFVLTPLVCVLGVLVAAGIARALRRAGLGSTVGAERV